MALQFEKKKRGSLDTLEIMGDEKGPTIILFHGYGADAYDLLPLSQLYKAAPKAHWVFPQGPLEIPIADNFSGRGWFPIHIEALKKAIHEKQLHEFVNAFPLDLTTSNNALEDLVRDLNVPLSSLYLGGFSQGGMVAIELAAHLKEKIAGLIILSSTFIDNFEWKNRLSHCAGLPFFLSHGRNDPILPYERAKELEQLFLSCGLKGQLLSFQGGHEIPQVAWLALHDFLHKNLSS